jgi:hypothetical protein
MDAKNLLLTTDTTAAAAIAFAALTPQFLLR